MIHYFNLEEILDLKNEHDNKKNVRFENGTKTIDGKEKDKEEENAIKDIIKQNKAKNAESKKKSKSDKKKSLQKARTNTKKSNQLEVQIQGTFEERKWDDFKTRKMISGQFSNAEVLALRTAICDYAQENNLTTDELRDFLNSSSKEKTYNRAWVEISRCLRRSTVT